MMEYPCCIQFDDAFMLETDGKGTILINICINNEVEGGYVQRYFLESP